MLAIDLKIERTQRLLRMLEQDAPLLAMRVAPLTPEYQQSAKGYAARLVRSDRSNFGRASALNARILSVAPSGA
jgi:hypothetical protein